ncbi:MAG: hypothetical protein FWH23_06510 [Bacteroidales bacterium]|nr:hypothetical protein [Bacteroidales bacterium]MCL2133682.1 hypothetical protein [Bacteroidales bacterium]
MPFIDTITRFNSVSIVGMAKNTGKTTCLNYVIHRLQEKGLKIALTSIGVDGEERDVLYDTPKPRIVLHEGMVFITSEKDFAQREFPAELLSVSERATPLGCLTTARAKDSGKVVLSGPSDSAWLQEMISTMPDYGVELTLVDGALSRMSLASPAVTDAMVLCTGAACSAQLSELIRRTKFRCTLISLPKVSAALYDLLYPLNSGVWLLTEKEEVIKKIAETVFTIDNNLEQSLSDKLTVYASGAVTDTFLKSLCGRTHSAIKLVVRDFSKLFVSSLTYDRFIRKGGSIEVLQKAKLLAVCTNPVSPEGTRLNPLMLKEEMQEALQLPVYDIVQIINNE